MCMKKKRTREGYIDETNFQGFSRGDKDFKRSFRPGQMKSLAGDLG